jgi:hypothetical protein
MLLVVLQIAAGIEHQGRELEIELGAGVDLLDREREAVEHLATDQTVRSRQRVEHAEMDGFPSTLCHVADHPASDGGSAEQLASRRIARGANAVDRYGTGREYREPHACRTMASIMARDG